MKVRQDFVTNSSSASFTIMKKDLTGEQMTLLLKYDEVLRLYYNADLPEEKQIPDDGEPSYWGDHWHIHDHDDCISGFTVMDNGDMWDVFKILGISLDIVDWDDD